MARAVPTLQSNRALARIEEKAQGRARAIAEYIVWHIRLHGPYDEHRPESHKGKTRLRNSYRAYQDPRSGDWLVKSRVDYWAYVEYGTRRPAKGPYTDRRPHVRPAIEAARRQFR